MKVVCFDFDDVITRKNIAMKLLGMAGHKFRQLKLELEMLEHNRDPKKFAELIKKFAELTKGMNIESVERILKLMKLRKGAKETFEKIKKSGMKIVIVSINDESLIKEFLLRNRLHEYVDHIYAAKIEVKNGILTGKITGDVLKDEKIGVLKIIEKKYTASKKDITYVGDGLTDLPIIKRVGRGILFSPNAITRAEVYADKALKKMESSGRLFLVENHDLRKILEFI